MENEDVAHLLNFELETLSGDLRDILLTHIRSMETPWSQLSEVDQKDRIDAIERIAETVVRGAVGVVAANGFETVHATIGKMTIDKGAVKFDCAATKSEHNVVALMDRQNSTAFLVLADPADYFGARGKADPDPDEPEMPFEADGEAQA